MLPVYNPRAAMAIGLLKRSYNDIEVYVEDTASLNMWMRIFRAILPETVNLKSVNMLGGREEVLTACRLDQSVDGRKKLYIIDGDLDFLRGVRKPRLKHLYRLRAYCAENLIISNDNIAEVAFDCDATSTFDVLKNNIDLENDILNPLPVLKSLFVVYATAFDFNSGMKTVRYAVTNLINSTPENIRICEVKVKARCRELLRDLCRKNSALIVSKRRKEIALKAKDLSLELSISGKDYILPLVHFYLRRSYGYKGTVEHLRAQLSKEFTPNDEPFFARRLLRLVA